MARRRERVRLENGLSLNLNRLAADGLMKAGQARSGTIVWKRLYSGEVTASGFVSADFTGESRGSLRLQLGALDQRIGLAAVPRHFLAAHAWNVGDLSRALQSTQAILTQTPDNALARLLKIEILIGENRSQELFIELDKPIEDLVWATLDKSLRVTSLLARFGYVERAVASAYRLFLEHRDEPSAWMWLSAILLSENHGGGGSPHTWDVTTVTANAAINVRFDKGETAFIVVEPDESLRKMDIESWEPTHPLVQVLFGMSVGANFIDPKTKRGGSITQLRHKDVARLHYVMEHYEARFPSISGFRRVAIDTTNPGGLDGLIAELKDHKEFVDREVEQYQRSGWPLDLLALRLRLDTIDAADLLRSRHVPIKMATGDQGELNRATGNVRRNQKKGVALDFLTFWSAHRMKAIEVVVNTCGPIILPQSVMGCLRARREQFAQSTKDGLRSVSYDAGKLTLNEVGPQEFQVMQAEVDDAIAWVSAYATVHPLVVGDSLPSDIRENLSRNQTDVFDAAILAMRLDVLLVSDDAPARAIGGHGDAWLYQIFAVALERGIIDLDKYVRLTATIIESGYTYVTITSEALVAAACIDSAGGPGVGPLFGSLIKMIGGSIAEPQSHVPVCPNCLLAIWGDVGAKSYRQAVTSALLERLLVERYDDHSVILKAVVVLVRSSRILVEYIEAWARGHFIPLRWTCRTLFCLILWDSVRPTIEPPLN